MAQAQKRRPSSNWAPIEAPPPQPPSFVGRLVDVVSRRGRTRGVELRLTEITAPGQVFMPFHFFETNVNEVTQSAFDPISREPNYKQCAVRVERSGVHV